MTSLGGLDYDRIHACVNDCILFRKAYPRHLATLPNDIHVDWLHEEMERAERDEGLHITAEEWEYARGCMLKVHRTNVNLHSL